MPLALSHPAAELSYVIRDSEATSAHGPFTYEQFHAGYSFDFARDGAALEVLLKEAPPGASGTVG